jgi:hypothetical protein
VPPPSRKGQYIVTQSIYRRNLRLARASAHDHAVAMPPYLSERDAEYFQKDTTCAEAKYLKKQT